ncbi:MAG: cold shock domain-containing protein [Desulfobacterales bacterium]|jgi:cold shock protein|nr:cold shock domain-containing protein [Desulfobacteraceae bacterium]MBT4364614.1 cold shock domain-containing protein [Desulfobacteraceae bacterium]MBT7085660.1 cold shock domain-containing protein [Desulfobacterales bacterium]
MKEGTVKWYNEKKGYGFIETEENDELFMHSSGIKDHGFFTLQKTDRVSYEIRETNRGAQAVNVRKIK